MDSMTPLERIMKVIRREITDRVPVAPIVWDFSAKGIGVSIQEFALNGKVMSKALAKYQREYGVDAVFVGSDVFYLAEGFGAKIVVREDHVPALVKAAIEDLSEVDRLRIPDPYRDGRMPVVLDCIRDLRKELPDVAIIAVGGQGPWSCALQIVGMENFLIAASSIRGSSQSN